jgi:phosphoesterase RecJ-like protein
MTESAPERFEAPPRAVLETLSGAPREVLLLGHVHPDADVLGTLFALGLALEGAGWSPTFAGPHPVPGVLSFLPASARYQVWTAAPRHFGVIVLTDCPNDRRTEGLLEQARGPESQVLNIDHHPDNRRYGTVDWIDPAAAATGEMVYQLVVALGRPVTRDIALNLFTAIHTDTGSFRYSNTTARTFRIAAELTRAGAEPALVTDWLYQRRPPGTLNELGEVLRRVAVSDDGRIAWLGVPRGLVSDSLVSSEDLVSYPRSLEGVKVAMLLREEGPSAVKVSLRAKGDVAVNRIAGRFGGGGHENAAGCTVPGRLDDVARTMLAAIREALPPE